MDERAGTVKALREEAARLRRKDANFPLSIGGMAVWLVAADWLDRSAAALERGATEYSLLTGSPFEAMALAEGA